MPYRDGRTLYLVNEVILVVIRAILFQKLIVNNGIILGGSEHIGGGSVFHQGACQAMADETAPPLL